MKKTRNRWLCALFVMAMLMNLTACGAVKKEEKPWETEAVKQEPDQIVKAEEQPEPKETGTIIPEETKSLLNVVKTSVGCQYSDSVDGEWHMVEVMQDCRVLENDSAKDYPRLAKALEDYKNDNESTI